MALSKTDKNISIMKNDHGTVCLITQYGEADRLLSLARKIKIDKRLEKQPVDSWYI